MPPAECLQVGDRVCASCALANLPEGSAGIVQRVFQSVELYDVLFDHQRVQYVLHRRDLVLMPPERVREAAR